MLVGASVEVDVAHDAHHLVAHCQVVLLQQPVTLHQCLVIATLMVTDEESVGFHGFLQAFVLLQIDFVEFFLGRLILFVGVVDVAQIVGGSCGVECLRIDVRETALRLLLVALHEVAEAGMELVGAPVVVLHLGRFDLQVAAQGVAVVALLEIVVAQRDPGHVQMSALRKPAHELLDAILGIVVL